MIRTYAYRLYPSKTQARLLFKTLETSRQFYNSCLEERKQAWEQERRTITKTEQLRRVKVEKASNPHAAPIHSHILQVVVTDLDKAYQDFFRRVRAGKNPGYPRFKSKNRFKSFGLKEYGNGFWVEGRRLRITGIGRVPIRLHRPINGVVKTVRIKRKAGKWYAYLACEVSHTALGATGKIVGIDVGIHHLMATSDHEIVNNPRWYQIEQAKLRVLQRTVSRREKGSRRRQKAVKAVQRQHEQIVNQRRDYLRKLVYHLIERYDVIAIEDLEIATMLGNRYLSKSILDAGWGYFTEHLKGKAEEAGRQVVKVDPAGTSRVCSSCGNEFEEMDLSHRWVECPCGLNIDRDINAAINIRNRVGHTRQALTYANGQGVA